MYRMQETEESQMVSNGTVQKHNVLYVLRVCAPVYKEEGGRGVASCLKGYGDKNRTNDDNHNHSRNNPSVFLFLSHFISLPAYSFQKKLLFSSSAPPSVILFPSFRICLCLSSILHPFFLFPHSFLSTPLF